ncbi:MAG: hypothetical protein RL213_846 [Bacteroidota bacterium]|jgi:hypothetical protein
MHLVIPDPITAIQSLVELYSCSSLCYSRAIVQGIKGCDVKKTLLYVRAIDILKTKKDAALEPLTIIAGSVS